MKHALRSKTKTRAMLVGYIVLLLSLALLTIFDEDPTNQIAWMITLGKAFGLVALTMLVAQLVFSSRIKLLERGIGLDTLMFWHKWNAKILTIFLFSHPILIYYGPLVTLGVSLSDAIIQMEPGHLLGAFGLTLVIVTVFFSIYSEKLRIPYHWWRVLHYGVYAIILIGFLHGLFVSSNIMSRNWVFWWWVFLVIVAGSLTVYRFIFRNKRKYMEFRVTKVVQETPDVRSIYLRSVNTPLVYAPGQFAFVRFFSRGLSREEHHFTLSSSPRDGEISFTIKELGDYTSQLDVVKEGDKALIDGPYGVFSNQGVESPYVFIAGGAGITPIMSMIRTLVKTGFREKATLIYGVRSKVESIFKEELEKYATEFPNLHLVYVYSAEEVAGAYYGIISKEVIEKEVQDRDTAIFYICGPKPMTKGVITTLMELGVSKSSIRVEIFSLK